MIIVNDLADVPEIPAIFKHAPDIGFTFADVIAPLFIFAIAVSYRQSFMKLAASDIKSKYLNFTRRYLALIGLGAIFSVGGAAVSQESSWGVLQSIGVAGIITLLVIRFPAKIRAGIAGVLLLVYQYILDNYLLEIVLSSSHGGIFGALSWGAMLILSTAMIDFYCKGQENFLFSGGVFTLMAVISLFVVPISKNRISLSYVLVSVAICCAVYYIFVSISKKLPEKSGIIACWGENPLLIYVLHLLIMGITRIPYAFLAVEVRPLWIAIITNLVILAIFSCIARKLHQRKVFISL